MTEEMMEPLKTPLGKLHTAPRVRWDVMNRKVNETYVTKSYRNQAPQVPMMALQ